LLGDTDFHIPEGDYFMVPWNFQFSPPLEFVWYASGWMIFLAGRPTVLQDASHIAILNPLRIFTV
jgi:hypothetical protein